MSVITLTTEWRRDDIYSGIIKGKLHSLNPGITVVDNASDIPAFNIPYASFIVRNTFPYYPIGSIHLIFVSSEVGLRTRLLAVKARGHYFIGTDNGIFHLILNSPPDEVVIIDTENRGDLDVFAETATAILSGKELNNIGKPVDVIKEKVPLRATIDKDIILGSVIFIDSYGNAITNITRDIFLRVFKDSDFRINVQRNKNQISIISTRYFDVPDGELMATFNHLNLLEIAINGANVSELFNLEIGSSVRIDHIEDKSKGNGLF